MAAMLAYLPVVPRCWLRSLFVSICVFTLLPLAGAAQTWREVKSPNFRVLTDGSERDGRAVAREFEQMRGVFADRFRKANLEGGAPLTIFAVREAGLKQLGPVFYKQRENVAGEFFTGWERQFAMVRLDSFGDQNQAVVFHEYTHSVLHANLHWLPTWLDEGLAEFYAYTRFQHDNIYIGAPTVRYRHLVGEAQIPVAKMLTANGGTFGNDIRMGDLFYGEAWAMVHYMTFGPEMEHGAKLDQFVALLESGTPQEEAFQKVFGEPKAFENHLSQYLSHLALTAGLLPPDKGPDARTFTARVLNAAEVNEEIGALDIGTGDRVSGKARIEAAIAADASVAASHEELGFLDWQEGKDADAKAEWQRAVALDGGLYRSSFALLMSGLPLREQTAGQLVVMQTELQGIIGKAPKFAPAYVDLALVQWRQGRMNDAYKNAAMAEKLAPWRAGYRLLVGYILAQGHQPAMAAAYARTVAARWPGSDHDEAVDLWSLLPAGTRGDGPALTFNLLAEATVVRGTIVESACEKDRFTVTLQPAAKSAAALTLASDGRFESGFSDTLWMGRDHWTTCHHLAGLPATVAYKAAGAQGGKLLAMDVRDDLPAFDPNNATPKASTAPVKTSVNTGP